MSVKSHSTLRLVYTYDTINVKIKYQNKSDCGIIPFDRSETCRIMKLILIKLTRKFLYLK